MVRLTTRTAVLTGLGVAGAAGALAIALAAGPALAEGATPSPSAPATGALAPDGARHTQFKDDLAAALAEELGIDEAKVTAALEKIHAARQAEARAAHLADLRSRLDTAVEEGTLTEAESAAILKAAEAGVLAPGPGPGGPGLGRPGGPGRPGR